MNGVLKSSVESLGLRILGAGKLGRKTRGKQTRQSTRVNIDTALACCFRVAVENGAPPNIDAIRERHGAGLSEFTLAELLGLNAELYLTLRAAQLNWNDLCTRKFDGPVLLVLKNHNVVLLRGIQTQEPDRAVVYDPLDERSGDLFLEREILEAAWDGVAVTTAPLSTDPTDKKFGFAWFTGKLFSEKSIMRDIFVAAMAMNLVTIAVPLFFQIILDKVLTNHAIATLTVLSIGIGTLIVFDAAFNYLRNLLLGHLTRKFDQSVSNETIDHLLSLPVDYFTRNSRGGIVHKLHEANNVRDFLASRLFNTVLDLTGVVVILPVLLIDSLQLTVLVLVVLSIAFLIITITSHRFRRQLEVVNAIEGRRKSVLVEYIQGITTIKTLAIETRCRRIWRRLSADSAAAGLKLSQTAAVARSILSGLEKGISVLIAACGVMLVLNEQLSVGALVAFNMLVMRITGPLINSASLIQDYQKAVLSLKLLGHLMRTEPESRSGQLMPAVGGEIEFDDVGFTYPGQATPALSNLSLHFRKGQRIGIVGRSGSGKTTITRLLQGLYQPQSGSIRIDGIDIKEMDKTHLRSRTGIVLQDNFFFRGSVRENLSLSRPHAPLEEVIRASKRAGADEFIQALPQGYMSILEENAQNLSGGQRQRLAIARVLLNKPPILIFDEATSSLDPESEEIVRASLDHICRGRTALIVTHRLSFVRDADLIVVLDRGSVLATGTHDELLKTCFLYKKFWNQQARMLAS